MLSYVSSLSRHASASSQNSAPTHCDWFEADVYAVACLVAVTKLEVVFDYYMAVFVYARVQTHTVIHTHDAACSGVFVTCNCYIKRHGGDLRL